MRLTNLLFLSKIMLAYLLIKIYHFIFVYAFKIYLWLFSIYNIQQQLSKIIMGEDISLIEKKDFIKEKFTGNSLHLNSVQIKPWDILSIIEPFKNMFSNLKKLQLWNNRIDAESIRVLALMPLQNMVVLDLRFNRIGRQGIKILVSCPFHNIQQLILNENSIGSSGIKHLIKGYFRSLTQLTLDSNRIGLEGIKHLEKGNFPLLKMISLDNNEINLRGVQSVRYWSYLPCIVSIGLGNNNISSLGIIHLMSIKFQQLKHLYLWNNGINKQLSLNLYVFEQKKLQIYI